MRIEGSILHLTGSHAFGGRDEHRITAQPFRERSEWRHPQPTRVGSELDHVRECCDQAAAALDPATVIDGDPKLRAAYLLLERMFGGVASLQTHCLRSGQP